jgi:hypothetical protein
MGTEAGAVDHALRVLDAKAHRKRLGFHEHAARCSISKVSRALWPSASTTWSAAICSPEASVTPAHRGRLDLQVGHALLEADLAAQRLDPARIFSIMLTSGRCRCAAC